MDRRRQMLMAVVVLLVAALAGSCQAQPPVPGAQKLMVPMRDGVKLATYAAFPAGAGPWPVILTRTPYGAKGAIADAPALTRNGVVRMVQDLRGRFESEGQDNVFLSDGWGKAQDGYDTIQWIAAQPWCNGKVGMIGGSAGGITQYLAAGAGPAALKCCCAVVACASLYHHAAYPGGAFRQHDMETWMQGNKFRPESIQQVLDHSDYDDLWATVNLADRAPQVHAAMIHSGGWFDLFCQGTLDAFMALQHNGGEGARGHQILEIGPWTHGHRPGGELTFPASALEEPVSRRAPQWLGHWLMGLPDPGIPEDKPVYYYLMGACGEAGAPGNEWRNVADWPVPATPTPLYLQPDGTATFAAPQGADASKTFLYDPASPVPSLGGGNLTITAGPMDQRPVESRPDVLVFTTAPLEKPLEVTGQVFARLFVASDCPDTDFTAKLTDVYPDGRSMLVCDGILRMRFRDGFRQERMMQAAAAYEVEVDLWSTSIIFNQGHRIRVAISSSNSPRFEPNPNTGVKFRADTRTQVAHNTLYLDRSRPSQVILPVPK